MFARLALLHDHGGQFSDGGRAATHARGGRSVPQLAGPRWLAGPADRHNQPFRSDAALRLVSPTLWGIPQQGGQILLVLSQAMACTVHTALHSTEHTLLLPANNTLFLCPLVFFPPCVSSACFHNIFCSHPSFPAASISSSLCLLCRIFPESLRWLLATQHYRRSKPMMLRIARKNQVDMTTEPSGVLTGDDIQQDEYDLKSIAFFCFTHIIMQMILIHLFMLCCSCFLVCDEMNMQRTQRHSLTYKDLYSCSKHVEVAAFPNSIWWHALAIRWTHTYSSRSSQCKINEVPNDY